MESFSLILQYLRFIENTDSNSEEIQSTSLSSSIHFGFPDLSPLWIEKNQLNEQKGGLTSPYDLYQQVYASTSYISHLSRIDHNHSICEKEIDSMSNHKNQLCIYY